MQSVHIYCTLIYSIYTFTSTGFIQPPTTQKHCSHIEQTYALEINQADTQKKYIFCKEALLNRICTTDV